MSGSHSFRRFMPLSSGFTLGELLGTLAIITATALFVGAMLFPIFAKAREGRHSSCASNIKQIELGFLQYAQDYDDKLPLAAQPLEPAKRVLLGWAMTHNEQGEAAETRHAENGYREYTNGPMQATLSAESPVMPYIKNSQIFRCQSVPPYTGPLSYMMNDLAAGASLVKIAKPDITVMLCDGEDFAGNVGHAYSPASPPAPAHFSPTGAVLLGATMQTAPTRHNGGANYGFADGHVKWLESPKVFFPSRSDKSPTHKDPKTGRKIGPDPADSNEMAAKGLVATFHLR